MDLLEFTIDVYRLKQLVFWQHQNKCYDNLCNNELAQRIHLLGPATTALVLTKPNTFQSKDVRKPNKSTLSKLAINYL